MDRHCRAVSRTVQGVDFIAVATVAPDYYGSAGFPPLLAHRLVAAAGCRVTPASGTSKKGAVACSIEVDSIVAHDLEEEGTVLQWCQDRLHKLEEPYILGTFYGGLFTLPLLCWRSCRYGTPIAVPRPEDSFDLADWTSFGFPDVKRLSITDCAEAMGMPKRFGTNIQERFFAQDYTTLLGFVETDLLLYNLVWLRFLLISGVLTQPQFAASGYTVMKAFNSRTQLAKDYIQQFDYRTFFLLPPK